MRELLQLDGSTNHCDSKIIPTNIEQFSQNVHCAFCKAFINQTFHIIQSYFPVLLLFLHTPPLQSWQFSRALSLRTTPTAEQLGSHIKSRLFQRALNNRTIRMRGGNRPKCRSHSNFDLWNIYGVKCQYWRLKSVHFTRIWIITLEDLKLLQ